ncbi:MAG: DUF3800 domain-containing protein [Alphaproteobacteria bacterium]|nr:DUF3800 domain-containing protein [Alphaproteobacteria bacterium]
MAFIFMYESGDLGFDFSKAKTSQYFVMAFLISENERCLNKIVAQTFKSINKKERATHSGFLHCNKEKEGVRLKLLKLLQDQQTISIIIIKLNKKRIYTRLNNEKQALYNYVCNILLDRLINKNILPPEEAVTFIASRRETNKFMNEQFKNYIKENIQSNHNLPIKVDVKTPQSSKGLQVVDFISWSVFRYYEYQDNCYYDMIKKLIVEDYSLYGI